MDFTYIQAASVSCGSVLLIGLYFYCKNKHSYWERKGIKGPRPWPLFGSQLEDYFGNRMKLECNRVKEYGKVYGSYRGLKPLLHIADPEVMQQICVKDFEVFPNHGIMDFDLFDQYTKSFLIALQGEHWKKVRAFMSPTFTSGKIRRMFRLLDGCAEDLISCCKEQMKPGCDSRATINAKEMYNLYTMDAIATCCYGLKLERARSKNLKSVASRDQFIEMAVKQFDLSTWRVLVSLIVPKWILLKLGFTISVPGIVFPFADKIRALLEKRRNSDKKFDDYLQLLVDAKLGDEMELDEMDQAENHHAGLTHESLVRDQKKMVSDLPGEAKLTLSDVEILSNAIFLLLVGLETTGTLLTNATCILAFHQAIQERLYQEIMKLVEYSEDKTKVSFNYDALTSCKYLDAVISETLRFYTPVLEMDRVSESDYKIEKYNINLPKGSFIQLGIFAMQNDTDFWDRPEEFNPERFMSGNRERIVPGSYCPFGMGPRHCIGMRFSLTEAKLALAKLVVNFKFEPAPGAKWPIEPKKSLSLNNMKNPTVTIVSRK